MAVQIINFVNLVFCFAYPAFSKYFRQESVMIYAQLGMVTSLFCITLFNYIELNGIMILFMVIFLFFFQFGIGTIGFIHIFETNVDSIIGFSNQILFYVLFISSIITPSLIEHLSVYGTFSFFGAISLAGLFYMICFVRHTSYIKESAENKRKEIVKCTDKEKKELYWPEEFKT